MAIGKDKQQVIAIEEHYWDPELVAHFDAASASGPPGLRERIEDLHDIRLKEMDEAGIDIQVLSHGNPSTQRLDAENGVRLARIVNDRLKETIDARPDRYAGFAALPTADPKAAADELERTVTRHGFKGAMIHGLANERFIDHKDFWPIYERAQALDVPIYVHPGLPHPKVVEIYYKDYVEEFPGILTAAWGFTVETATQGVRLVLSGVFDKYPDLKIVLGHLGEGLPFLLWRINHAFGRQGNRPPDYFRDAFSSHFWVTTSGFFSDPALLCCVQELGVDRILFSVDWPYADNKPGTEWMEHLQMSAEDKAKILNGNAKRLLKM